MAAKVYTSFLKFDWLEIWASKIVLDWSQNLNKQIIGQQFPVDCYLYSTMNGKRYGIDVVQSLPRVLLLKHEYMEMT